MVVQLPQSLHHYQLVEQIGRGGMGAVWKAIDTRLEREVAVKVLPSEFAQDPERTARFRREARVLAALSIVVAVELHKLLRRPPPSEEPPGLETSQELAADQSSHRG